MPVAVGSRFGPYEILASLGAGGMGEVYRARDERLDRAVAVKVLAQEWAADPELRERFRREARALSRLSHPNICAVFDVGTEGGRDYFVMELLEGETLAARLDRGPLPVEESIDVARQIAGALATSHRRGLVHRDLKPANVMLTSSGVKLLDFGLVRFTGVAASSHATFSETLTSRGAILGTIQYMSPEQVEGREADARSDVFSFGVLVYEMITGRRAFAADTQASTIAAILKEDPSSLRALQPAAPTELDSLVRSCLAKNPEERWQSAHDLYLELGWLGERVRRADTTPLTHRPTTPRFWIAAATLIAAVTGVLVWQEMRPRHVERPALRATINAPPDSQFIAVGTQAGPAVLSPDGRRVAFIASSPDGRVRVWVHSLASLVAHALPGTEGASHPFWSPDAERIGFFAEQRLKWVSIAGGTVTTLCDAAYGAGGTWNRDGTIVFASRLRGGLERISATGGSPRPATTLSDDRREFSHRWPVFLPDGRRFLYTAGEEAKPGRWTIRVAALDSERVDDVLEGHSNAVYANGALIFARGGTLLAQPVDERSMRATGDAVTLAENVLHDVALGRAVFSASDTGTLVYQTGSAVEGSRLVWVDRSGTEVGTLQEKCFCTWPSLSPDGLRAAIADTDPNTGSHDIWIYDVADGRRRRLTFEEALEANPVWTADGSRIAFTSTRRGIRDVHWTDALGGGEQEPLLESDRDKTVQSASSSGIVFVEDGDLWLLPLTGDRKPQPLVRSEHNQLFGQISPDGRWLLYQSNARGGTGTEVYVTSFPARKGQWLVSESSGLLPRWSTDGQEIFYLSPDHSTLFAAAVTPQGSALAISHVRRLFSAPMLTGRGYPYDVSRDGQRFLVVVSPGATTAPLTLVIDWPSELKR